MRLKLRGSDRSPPHSGQLAAPPSGWCLAQVVLAPAPLALAEALDERVGEALEVARGLPRLRVHEDRRVEGDHVVALLDHRAPPLGLDVRLQQHAVVAVVVGRGEPAVDLRGLEDEAAPLAERDDLVHGHGVGRHGGNPIRPGDPKGCKIAGIGVSRRRMSGVTVPISPMAIFRPIGHLAAWLVWHSMRVSLLDDSSRRAPPRRRRSGRPWHSYTRSAMPIYEYRCETATRSR